MNRLFFEQQQRKQQLKNDKKCKASVLNRGKRLPFKTCTVKNKQTKKNKQTNKQTNKF